jgi:hypothetical protein
MAGSSFSSSVGGGFASSSGGVVGSGAGASVGSGAVVAFPPPQAVSKGKTINVKTNKLMSSLFFIVPPCI